MIDSSQDVTLRRPPRRVNERGQKGTRLAPRAERTRLLQGNSGMIASLWERIRSRGPVRSTPNSTQGLQGRSRERLTSEHRPTSAGTQVAWRRSSMNSTALAFHPGIDLVFGTWRRRQPGRVLVIGPPPATRAVLELMRPFCPSPLLDIADV